MRPSSILPTATGGRDRVSGHWRPERHQPRGLGHLPRHRRDSSDGDLGPAHHHVRMAGGARRWRAVAPQHPPHAALTGAPSSIGRRCVAGHALCALQWRGRAFAAHHLDAFGHCVASPHGSALAVAACLASRLRGRRGARSLGADAARFLAQFCRGWRLVCYRFGSAIGPFDGRLRPVSSKCQGALGDHADADTAHTAAVPAELGGRAAGQRRGDFVGHAGGYAVGDGRRHRAAAVARDGLVGRGARAAAAMAGATANRHISRCRRPRCGRLQPAWRGHFAGDAPAMVSAAARHALAAAGVAVARAQTAGRRVRIAGGGSGKRHRRIGAHRHAQPAERRGAAL